MASAAGGYDIPAGVNPMTQLHQEEMVLPASLANGLRGIIAAGGGKSGGNGGNTYIQALDAGSFFDRKGATILKSLKKQMRNMHVRF